MVPRFRSLRVRGPHPLGRVPRFASLRDFILCRNWFARSVPYLQSAERSDTEQRLRRHFKDSFAYNSPDFLLGQNYTLKKTESPH